MSFVLTERDQGQSLGQLLRMLTLTVYGLVWLPFQGKAENELLPKSLYRTCKMEMLMCVLEISMFLLVNV